MGVSLGIVPHLLEELIFKINLIDWLSVWGLLS